MTLGDELVEVLDCPRETLRVVEPQQAAIFSAVNPLGMRLR